MKNKSNNDCMEEKDALHHLLEEQIVHICVLEEEEQIRNELKSKHSNIAMEDIRKN